jgi:hypothetical protein
MMKWFLLLLILVSSPLAWSQSKKEINSMLEQFKSSGLFTPEQIAQAQKELEGMDDKEVEQLKGKALERAQDPDIQQHLQKLKP